MSIFSAFKNTDVKIEKTTDSVGGSVSFGVVDTDVYNCTIKQAYVDQSAGGATSVTFEFQSDAGNVIRSTQWITSGKAKGQKHYYTDKKGKNHNLPGYTIVDDIHSLITEQPLSAAESEEKQVKVYDFDKGAQVAVPKQVLTELIGQKIVLAIEKQIVDKNIKNGEGAYVPSGETREQNEVVKVFCEDGRMTMTERLGGADEGTFVDTWISKNKGETKNRAKGTAAQPAGNVAGLQASPVADAPKTTSLFG